MHVMSKFKLIVMYNFIIYNLHKPDLYEIKLYKFFLPKLLKYSR